MGPTDTKVFGGRLEEGVLGLLGGFASAKRGGSGLLSGLGLGGLVIETKISIAVLTKEQGVRLLRSSSVVV